MGSLHLSQLTLSHFRSHKRAVVDCDARTMGIEVPADPEDAKVLATAVAGKVDALVGNDHHLLDLAKESSVPILRPGEYLRRNRR